MRLAEVGDIWDKCGAGSEGKEDVGHDFSKGSLSETLTILFLEVVALDRNWGVKFEDDELKERVSPACFANSTLSIFEHVEVEGFDNDVEDKECDIEDVALSILP